MCDNYRSEIDPLERLNTCGICGYRDYNSLFPVHEVPLSELGILKMSPDQYSSYMAVDQKYRCCFGVTEYESEIYYIIPYFVNGVGKHQTVARCDECHKHMKAGKIPPLSMANENYGTPQAEFGMKCYNLSATSKNMMFLVRGYNQIIELSTVSGKPHAIRARIYDTFRSRVYCCATSSFSASKA